MGLIWRYTVSGLSSTVQRFSCRSLKRLWGGYTLFQATETSFLVLCEDLLVDTLEFSWPPLQSICVQSCWKSGFSPSQLLILPCSPAFLSLEPFPWKFAEMWLGATLIFASRLGPSPRNARTGSTRFRYALSRVGATEDRGACGTWGTPSRCPMIQEIFNDHAFFPRWFPKTILWGSCHTFSGVSSVRD